MSSGLAIRESLEDLESEGSRVDEPRWPTIAHRDYYRELIRDLEAELLPAVAPSLRAVTRLQIQQVAREHLVQLIADQGSMKANQLTRDRKLLAHLKQLADNVHKTDATPERLHRLVLGLIPVIMNALEGRLGHDRLLCGKVKEDIGQELAAYIRQELPA